MAHERLSIAADALHEARQRRRPIPPISTTYGITTLDDAYAVAELGIRRRIDAGARIIGKKVGLTSAAVQQQLGVSQPDFGMLLSDMELADGEPVPMERLIQPKIEAEIAFVIGRDLPERSPSYSEFLVAIAYALPALEIVDSAIVDWKISLVDTVADNASCGMYVLGTQPVLLGLCDLATVTMQLDRNGYTASTGTGAASLGHPLRAAYWLARTMAERGRSLRAGEVILSGALGPMVPLERGDVIEAHITSLGTVTCRGAS